MYTTCNITYFTLFSFKKDNPWLNLLTYIFNSLKMYKYFFFNVSSCKMTHASLSKEVQTSLGINENLIRLSIGLEYVQDLIDDLDQALKASGAKPK